LYCLGPVVRQVRDSAIHLTLQGRKMSGISQTVFFALFYPLPEAFLCLLSAAWARAFSASASALAAASFAAFSSASSAVIWAVM
jgi:hypothetical protein